MPMPKLATRNSTRIVCVASLVFMIWVVDRGWLARQKRIGRDGDLGLGVGAILRLVQRDGAWHLADAADQLAVDIGFHICNGPFVCQGLELFLPLLRIDGGLRRLDGERGVLTPSGLTLANTVGVSVICHSGR